MEVYISIIVFAALGLVFFLFRNSRIPIYRKTINVPSDRVKDIICSILSSKTDFKIRCLSKKGDWKDVHSLNRIHVNNNANIEIASLTKTEKGGLQTDYLLTLDMEAKKCSVCVTLFELASLLSPSILIVIGTIFAVHEFSSVADGPDYFGRFFVLIFPIVGFVLLFFSLRKIVRFAKVTNALGIAEHPSIPSSARHVNHHQPRDDFDEDSLPDEVVSQDQDSFVYDGRGANYFVLYIVAVVWNAAVWGYLFSQRAKLSGFFSDFVPQKIIAVLLASAFILLGLFILYHAAKNFLFGKFTVRVTPSGTLIKEYFLTNMTIDCSMIGSVKCMDYKKKNNGFGQKWQICDIEKMSDHEIDNCDFRSAVILTTTSDQQIVFYRTDRGLGAVDELAEWIKTRICA